MSVSAVNSSGSAATLSDALNPQQLGKEAFLQLLVTQLQNQDPMNPMEDKEFISQLSQFSSLEELQNINSVLGQNNNALLSVHNAMMTDMIGKAVKVQGDVVHISPENQKTVFSYDLPEKGTVKVEIYDSNDQLVRTIDADSQKAGEHNVVWDGLDDSGNSVAQGSYTAKISYTDSDGESADLTCYLMGKVSGVRFVEGTPILFIGDQSVSPANIVAIYNEMPADSQENS